MAECDAFDPDGYDVGDPDCGPIDVNVVGPDPFVVEIGNFDEMPLGIEASLAPVGCIVDGCDVVGKVFVCKVVDEATGAESYMLKYIAVGSGDVVDYDPATHGDWGDCDPPDCADPCLPAIYSTTGAAPAMSGIHRLDIDNPTCCPIVVTASIGAINVPAFRSLDVAVDCPFDVTAISVPAECDPAEVSLVGVTTH